MGHLVLDPLIRDWVLIPLTVVIVAAFMLRTQVLALLESSNSVSVAEFGQRNLVARSARLRANGRFLDAASFAGRKNFLVGSAGRGLRAKDLELPMVNPMSQMDAMKTQAVNLLMNIGLGHLATAIFQGFVLVKIPFELASRFKSITQRDIDLSLLEPSYVSSFSWYMLLQFGSRGLVYLLLGSGSTELADESKMMMMQMGMGGGKQAWDPNAAFKAESENLRLATYSGHVLASAESKLVEDFAAARNITWKASSTNTPASTAASTPSTASGTPSRRS